MKPVLRATFSWLTDIEVDQVAERLQVHVSDTMSARDQMLAFGRILDQIGLRVTGPLLLSLVGRGSKTAAVEVARDISRARFERAFYDTSAETPAGAGTIDTAAVSELLRGQLADLAFQPHSSKDLEALSARVGDAIGLLKHVAGDVRWLKSSIDTERQLRRYINKHGPLEEPAAAAASDQERRNIIGNLAQSLQKDYYRSNTGRPMPDPEPHEG